MWRVFLFCTFVLFAQGTLPTLANSTVKIKDLSLLGTELSLATYTFTFDQELYLHKANFCPVYNCTADALTHIDQPACVCDYATKSSCGTGYLLNTSTPCSCDISLCDTNVNPWTEVALGGAQTFRMELAEGETRHWRVFVNTTCTGFRAHVTSFAGTSSLRISNKDIATLTNSYWKKTNEYEKEEVFICPVDQHFVQGTYFIAVSATTQTVFDFAIEEVLVDQPKVANPSNCGGNLTAFPSIPGTALCVQDGIPVNFNNGQPLPAYYFNVTFTNGKCTPVFVNIQTYTSDAALACSISLPRDAQKVQWKTYDRESFLVCPVGSESWTPMQISLRTNHLWAGPYRFRLSVSTSHFNTSWTHTRLADIAANEVNFDLLGTTTVETNPYPVSQSFQFTTTLITLSDYFFMCTSWKENCKGLSFSTNSNPLYPVPPIVWNLPGVGDQFRTIQGNYSLPSTPNDPKSYSAVVVLSYRTNTYVVNIPESGVEVISINFHGKVGSLDGDVLYGNHTATLIKPSCEYDEFQNDLQEINQILDDLSGTSDATAIDTLRYKLDSAAYQDGFTFCREYVDNLTVGVSSQNFTIASYFCPYVFGTAEWVASACCNQGAIWRASCVPSNLTGPLPKFEVQQEAVKSVCKHTECSQSYLEDYSSAKAAFESGQCSVDPVQQKIRDETTQKQYLACKAQAFPFSGENCVNDQDCHYYYDNTTYACSMSSLTCVVPYELMEEAFIDCLRLLLTEGSEAYLQSKYNIVAGREDPAFTQQWMAAVRSPDCVDLFGNSVNLEHRTKHIISAADVLCGNRYSCPSVECEDTSCPFAEQACLASCGMAKLKQDGIESQCVSESVCNWDSNLCDGATLANCTTLCQNPGPSFCGFCDSADECTQFSEISSPAQCASTSVCLLPNGTYFFNLTDSQCDALTKCDLPYCGRQCSASNPTYSSGICFSYEPDSTSCTSKSGQWLNNTGAHTFSNNSNICVFSAQDSATCAGTVGTTWQTCGALSLYSCAQCANGNCNSLTQNLMQCAITGKPCPDATTCANSGICSDSEYYLNMASPQKYGGCTMGRFPAPDIMSFTYCPASAMISVPNKCIWITSLGYDNTSCNHLNVTYFASSWILPAEDQATCLAPKACLELFDQQERFSQKNQANCLAADGDVWTNTWEWRQGRWMGGVKRSLSWTARSASLKYNWTSTLDFSEVQDAFYQAVLQNDVLDSKSASLCQYQRTLVPMEAVTCDCTESGSGDCFETDPLSVIAQARVCSGVNDTEFYSGLRLTTSTDTVDIGCAEILISTISIRNYASVTKERLLANFIPLTERAVPQFPIFNDHGALVGQILTDGVTITPLADASLGSFELCIQLQAAQKQYEASSEFPVFDFATTDAKKQDIIPMKFDAHQIKILQNSVYDGDYLCSTVSNITQETTYFAIERKANYEDEQKDLLSPQAEALSFTLAAMFAVTALISSAQIVYYVFNYFFNQLPFILEHVLILFIWMFVSVRTIYFFLLSSGYDSSVGDYALVALPTFFYFTAFSIIVVLWAVVASKRFTNDAAAFKRIINRALIGINMFLYAIFIALVLSFQFAKSTSDSPCSGRQQGEDNSSQIQKSISIAYGLVIAIISMIIGLLFVVFGYRIRTFIAASESHERIFIVTAVCSVSFILHSIFIVVVAFLQSPNLYFSFFGLIVTEWFPAVFIIVWLFIRRSGVKSSSRDSRSLNTKNTLSSGTRVNVKSNSSRSRTDDNTITSDGVELPTYKST